VRTSTGALLASLTLPGALLTSIDAGGPAIAPFTNTLYLLATTTTSLIGIYLSRDNLSTFNLLATMTSQVRGGNLFYTNGCIYGSAGVATRFFKVCP